MKKNEVQELLRKNKIYNNHEILSRFGQPKVDDVAIEYHPYVHRSCKPNASKVMSPSHKTDLQSHWSNYGQKSFVGNKSSSEKEAMGWAKEKYNIREWKTSPFGGKIPITVWEKLQKFIKDNNNVEGS